MRYLVGDGTLYDACSEGCKGIATGIIGGELRKVLSPPPVLVGGGERRSSNQAGPQDLQGDAHMFNGTWGRDAAARP